MADDKLAERIGKIGDRVSHVVALASPSPDLMRANEGAYAALRTLLAVHEVKPYYEGADQCDHSEPQEGTAAWDDWADDHPLGAGDVGRICVLTQVGNFCPACSLLAYDNDEPGGDDYVSAPCDVRTLFEQGLTRTISEAEIDAAVNCG